MAQVVDLGLKHEETELQRLLGVHGPYDPARRSGVRILPGPGSPGHGSAEQAAQLTREALADGADVLYQAAFFDGEFRGYADFVRGTEEGWVVCDTKLARHAKPQALLQLAAYADQLTALGVEVAPTVELLLGNGDREVFPLADVAPVFRERRGRLRELLRHVDQGQPAIWGTPGIAFCGSCADCTLEIEATQDLLLVARMRKDQRRKLMDAGIATLEGLTSSTTAPPGLAVGTYELHRAQAALQLDQMASGEVTATVRDEQAILRLPEPSPGDIFFDFEGDPLYSEGDPRDWGLEYLWGMTFPPAHEAAEPEFVYLWADDHAAERQALADFLELVAERRAKFPDMHVYHYAPYEVTALKRLVGKHPEYEEGLDDLLRKGCFVDLYATVRGGVLVSQPSYSIKYLEPLYMDRPRESDVKAGDASIAEYHRYRVLLAHGDLTEAAVSRESLREYNEYDCLSTLGLRDWLRGLVEGSAAETVPLPEDDEAPQEDAEPEPLYADLMARSGPEHSNERSPAEQTWAMLAAALDYHRREERSYWWEHFARLRDPLESWCDSKDCFAFDADDLTATDWEKAPGKHTFSRTLTATGRLGGGSTVEAPIKMQILYGAPVPEGCKIPEGGQYAVASIPADVNEIHPVGNDLTRVVLVERLKKNVVGHDMVPLALVPGTPPFAGPLRDAIRAVANRADSAGALPDDPAIDILCRVPPRLGGRALSRTGDTRADLVESLRHLDRSYLAVQGPPGTGKTWTGARVIKDLVEQHGWRVGVVAQSHAVVENMLGAIVKAGLDPARVGKKDNREPSPTWTSVTKPSVFLGEHEDQGCVIGGTAWTFTGKEIERNSLDLLVIDEAGQFSLANTIAVSVAAQRLLLLGDPQQLPQVSQGRHAEPVDESALSWIIDGHASMPQHLGYFLETTYRMHPALCDRVSTLSYDGRLHAAPQAAARHLDGVAPGLRVSLVDHQDNSTSSPEEARQVVAEVRDLLGRQWYDPEAPEPRGLGEEDVLVVTPFNAQRILVQKELAAAGLRKIRVGTVDKFQGKEAPVVVVSMTASAQEDVPRGMEFLLNRNRVNVAISRAQWLAVVVRSPALTRYMPSTVRELRMLGAFTGLCE
ncbi:TM0106 family RecB-like putative nuclease [Nocardioides houyundeii]|uniref:TM0106 family RecB-like putative nuclease n=1 Tax=Nocardioides houyundeii TaxID=2045452 RepID=UPI001315287B|nr:bifunctional RecB family nuclease/DEAD/DEAH box helicase [Nocardioides houyundeii]